MKYSVTYSSGTSSVVPGVRHFLLIFPTPHGGAFVAFCRLLKQIPTYIPGWGGGGGVRVYFDWCIMQPWLIVFAIVQGITNFSNKKN